MRVDLSHRTVLLVEGNQSVRRLIRAMLANLGLRSIVECQTPAEACEYLAREVPDVVLSQFDGAGLECSSLIRRLRDPAVSPWQDIPVVGLCASPSKDLVLAARDCGVAALLVMPLSLAMLRSRLEQVLEGRPLARERRVAPPAKPPERPAEDTVFL
jgi:two-component system, chemotaxis family, chemotaxis protein CheY